MPSPPHHARLTKTILFAVLLTAAGAARAETDFDQRPLDFALHLARLKTALHGPGQGVIATVKQAGVSSYDIGNPALRPGLLLGYVWIDLADQGVAAALAPEGFYLGAAVRSQLYRSPHLALTVTASFLYQRVRDSNTIQTVTLDWYQPQLDADALWRLSPRLDLRLGGTYGRVDTDEKLSGAVNQSLSLAADAGFGGRAGLELDVDRDGQIGFMVHQAVGDGIEFYFQRQF